MKKAIFSFFSFFLLLSFSCEKDPLNPEPPNSLPPATMTGENTLGCLVNGEVWRPYVEGANIWESAIYAKHDLGWPDCDQLLVSGDKELTTDSGERIKQELTINVWCPVLGLNNLTPAKGAFVCFDPCGCSYDIDTLHPYIMDISRLDSFNKIASGTFEFIAISKECQDTVRITEGRFDVDSSL